MEYVIAFLILGLISFLAQRKYPKVSTLLDNTHKRGVQTGHSLVNSHFLQNVTSLRSFAKFCIQRSHLAFRSRTNSRNKSSKDSNNLTKVYLTIHRTEENTSGYIYAKSVDFAILAEAPASPRLQAASRLNPLLKKGQFLIILMAFMLAITLFDPPFFPHTHSVAPHQAWRG
jgi:hypothetical protein